VPRGNDIAGEELKKASHVTLLDGLWRAIEGPDGIFGRHSDFDPGQVHQPNQCEDASARALWRSVPEGIQDGHVEMREIAFVPSGHGEAVNASSGGYHGILS
jgi:hypothetical protein